MNDIKVRDVMTHLVAMVHPQDSLAEASKRMARNNISGAPVVEAGRVVGVVSEADLIRAAMPPVHVDKGAGLIELLSAIMKAKPISHPQGVKVKDVMTYPPITISPEASIWKAAEILDYRDIKRLPVVDDEGYVIGIISRADLVKAMARTDEQLRQDVTEAIGILGVDVIEDLNIHVQDGMVTLAGEADRRSTQELCVKLASRVPGALEVRDRMTFNYDDSKFPAEPMTPQPSEGLTVGSVVRQGEL